MGILERYEEQIHEGLHEWAGEHTASHERLVLLDINPKEYSAQRLLTHTIHGEPIDPVLMDTVAGQIDSRQPRVAAAIDANETALQVGADILSKGENLAIGTGHDELVDVALELTHLIARYKQQGIAFDSSLIANKIATYLGVEMDDGSVIPVPDVLGWAFDETYFTIPNTSSTGEKLAVPKRAIAVYNQSVCLHGIEKRLKATRQTGRPMMMGVAVSGTVNKPLDRERYHRELDPAAKDKKVKVVGRANTGTLRFMKLASTLLMCSRMQGDIAVTMSPQARQIDTEAALTAAMRTIARMQTELDPDSYYLYDETGDLPVIRQKPESI